MWLPKPVYEALPYVYAALGVLFIGESWIGATGWLSALLLVAGSGLLLIGIVLWLRRKDFRDEQRQYNAHSLDE
jgi:hypothetical protein